MKQKFRIISLLILGSIVFFSQERAVQSQSSQRPSWFIPATHLTAEAFPNIHYNSKDESFVYSYDVSNRTQSTQALAFWALAKIMNEQAIKAPPGWDTASYTYTDLTGWYVVEGTEIAPGAKLSGFQIESKQFPGFVKFYYQANPSYTLMPNKPDDISQEELENLAILDGFPNNYVEGQTIGPDSDLSGLNGRELVNYLIDQKHACANLGWIDNNGIVVSLDAKLNSALKAIDMSKIAQAKNHISAFMNELDVQKGKHVNQNAYSFLSSIAEYLLAKL